MTVQPTKIGRPTVMTKAVLDALRQAFLWGATDVEASAYAGIARSTLSEYKARKPDFSDKVRAWKLNPILLARKTVCEDLSINARTAMWYLERKRKEEFSLRYEQKSMGPSDISAILIRQETDYDELGRKVEEQLSAINQN